MRFLPRHDLVSSEHSKGRRLARPVHTKQTKAFLNQKWLIITHKYRILSSHLVSDSKGEASNSVESSKLL